MRNCQQSEKKNSLSTMLLIITNNNPISTKLTVKTQPNPGNNPFTNYNIFSTSILNNAIIGVYKEQVPIFLDIDFYRTYIQIGLIYIHYQCKGFLQCQSIIAIRSFKTFDFSYNYLWSHMYEWSWFVKCTLFTLRLYVCMIINLISITVDKRRE
jgi:hypothetical protein